MTTRIALDTVIAAAPAHVTVTRDGTGAVTQAAFDLSGLPRVDAALIGRPVMEVPSLVAHLCGICPSAHHLAGMRALESLAGLGELPPTAQAVRRLLHLGGVVAIHVVGLIATDRDDALVLRRFAKAAMAAAGSPGHFPVTGVPGGVAAPIDAGARDACLALLPDALAAANRIAERGLLQPSQPDSFTGADVVLVDQAGRPDLFGTRLRAIGPDGRVLIDAAPPQSYDDLVAEAMPGSPTPKPYLVPLGKGSTYRVGPVAQQRAGLGATSPAAAVMNSTWRTAGFPGGAATARAIVVVDAVETIGGLLADKALEKGPCALPWPKTLPAGVGVGWVDGARGLLVHRYQTTADGRIAAATILTPTAQNEPWLGELLASAATPSGAAARPEAGDAIHDRVEWAIKEADPCLPCSSAPAGTMDLVIDDEPLGTDTIGPTVDDSSNGPLGTVPNGSTVDHSSNGITREER